MLKSTKFKTTVFESRLVQFKSVHIIINLKDGKFEHTKPDFEFKKVAGSVKTDINFLSANTKEGFLNLIFLRLDNNNSFLFLIGNAHSITIFVGGNFLSGADTLNFNPNILDQYIHKNIATWVKYYKESSRVELLSCANALIRDVYALIP